MDTVALGVFLTAAVGLLGSPGPAIAALVAVGRARGFVGGLSYFLGLQLGLATACGITAAGLFSLLAAFPSALRVMTIAATVYLIYLAYKIASSPVGATARASNGAHASGGISAGRDKSESLSGIRIAACIVHLDQGQRTAGYLHQMAFAGSRNDRG
ncbi:MAG: LysE family transporter [Bradyrhizobium sp.]